MKSTMEELEQIKKEIELIKKRNASVEIDKAWERSYLRRFLVALFTFLSISLYMRAIHIDRPFLNAIVPTIGFMLSTLALPWFKKIWSEKS